MTPLGYTGQEGDDELGLVNMRGRIYDPRVARFLTIDPIVHDQHDTQAWNSYSYVWNSPLNFVDPTGFDPPMPSVIREALGPDYPNKPSDLPKVADAHPPAPTPSDKGSGSRGASPPTGDKAATKDSSPDDRENQAPKADGGGEPFCANCGEGGSPLSKAEYERLTYEHEMMSQSLSWEHGEGAGAAHMGVWALRYRETGQGPTPPMVRSLRQTITMRVRLRLLTTPRSVQMAPGGSDADSQGESAPPQEGAPFAPRAGAAGGTRAGKAFTPSGKARVLAANKEANGGVNKCAACGVETVPGQQSRGGVPKPPNEAHIDHIIPRAKGGNGSPENGQVLCSMCNLKKRDN